MTMWYSNSDMQYLAAKEYQREVDKQNKIIEESKRRRNSAALSRKPVQMKKPASARHA
jgi:hypothetical protein